MTGMIRPHSGDYRAITSKQVQSWNGYGGERYRRKDDEDISDRLTVFHQSNGRESMLTSSRFTTFSLLFLAKIGFIVKVVIPRMENGPKT